MSSSFRGGSCCSCTIQRFCREHIKIFTGCVVSPDCEPSVVKRRGVFLRCIDRITTLCTRSLRLTDTRCEPCLDALDTTFQPLTCSSMFTLLNARLRRGRVNNSRFHGVKDWFLHSEDAVAAAGGGRQRVKTMVAYSLDQVTMAMPLPDTSGEREQAASSNSPPASGYG